MGCCVLKALQATVPTYSTSSEIINQREQVSKKFQQKMMVNCKTLPYPINMKVQNNYIFSVQEQTKDCSLSSKQKLARLYDELSQQLKQRLNIIKKTIVKRSNTETEDYVALVKQLMKQGDKQTAKKITMTLLEISSSSIYQELNVQTVNEVYLLKIISQMEAEKSINYRSYLQRLTKIFEQFPQYYIEQQIPLINNVAVTILNTQRTSRFKQAIQLFQQSIKLQEKYFLQNDKRLYYAQCNLAGAYFDNKQYQKGQQLFKKLIEELSKKPSTQLQQIKQQITVNYNQYTRISKLEPILVRRKRTK